MQDTEQPVCWIDADCLVFHDLTEILDELTINFVTPGTIPSNESLDCGGGVVVNGDRFAFGAIFLLPYMECIPFLQGLVIERQGWSGEEESAYWQTDGEQCLLRHLTMRDEARVQ